MPKLPALKPRQVIRFLEQNGFALDHTSGSHFIFYNPITRRRAVVPSHNRDLPKGNSDVVITGSRIHPRGADRFSGWAMKFAEY